MYFLLPSGNDAYVATSINYLKSKQPVDMQSSSVFVVVSPYHTNPVWFGNDTNTAQGTLVLARELDGVSDGALADNLYKIVNYHGGLALAESGTGNLADVIRSPTAAPPASSGTSPTWAARATRSSTPGASAARTTAAIVAWRRVG